MVMMTQAKDFAGDVLRYRIWPQRQRLQLALFCCILYVLSINVGSCARGCTLRIAAMSTTMYHVHCCGSDTQ